MTKYAYFLLKISFLPFLILFTVACSKEVDKKIEEAYKDGSISTEEFNVIAQMLRKGRDKIKYDTDDKVWEYIKIHSPNNPPATPTASVPTKPNYSVFLENSASMDGYVGGNSEFKNAVFNFLSDISLKTNDLTDSLKLYYINSSVIPHNSSLSDFIDKLSPADFKAKGGVRGTTDIHEVLSSALKTVQNQNEVAIFISDCVFSPGKGKEPKNYLAGQSAGIKLSFGEALYANKDLATIIVKLNSSFSGTYYDYENKEINLQNQNRPYYIWIIGKYDKVQTLLNKVKLKDIKGGIENYYALYPSTNALEYEIIRQDKIGNFAINRTNKNEIENAKVSERGNDNGTFQLAIAVNFNNLGQAEDFLLDGRNYKMNNQDYSIEVKKIEEQEKANDPSLSKYSHKLLLKTQKLFNTKLDIELQRTMPKWIEDTHSEDDKIQSGAELRKTFGFKYMIEGVTDAYESITNGQNSFFKIQITIKK